VRASQSRKWEEEEEEEEGWGEGPPLMDRTGTDALPWERWGAGCGLAGIRRRSRSLGV
jgi:hypothetical protein